MKKIYSVLSAFLVLFLVACGNGTSTDPDERDYEGGEIPVEESNEGGDDQERSYEDGDDLEMKSKQ